MTWMNGVGPPRRAGSGRNGRAAAAQIERLLLERAIDVGAQLAPHRHVRRGGGEHDGDGDRDSHGDRHALPQRHQSRRT